MTEVEFRREVADAAYVVLAPLGASLLADDLRTLGPSTFAAG